jgi:60 kDa SS-A/Ro ribonucleoprotein
MAVSSLTRHLTSTDQQMEVPGKTQVKNSAGGFVFKISPLEQLKRFLILGTEGGTYYATEAKLTLENAKNVIGLIKTNGLEVVRTTVEISDAGRAPKNDQAIFVMALACTYGDADTKKAAYDSLTKVCRIGTHIMQFCGAVNDMRGWSGGLRKAVSNFYTQRSVDGLAMQLVKYRDRAGWTHEDVLRLAHTSSKDPQVNALLRWATTFQDEDMKATKVEDLNEVLRSKVAKNRKASAVGDLHPLVLAYEQARRLASAVVAGDTEVKAGLSKATVKQAVSLIKDAKLPWEALPTEFLKEPAVWEALLPNMGFTALIRNLGRLTSIGVLSNSLSDSTRLVVSKLTDKDGLNKARVHPFQVLLALSTYDAGQGVKGSLSWSPVRAVSDALDEAFYLSYEALPRMSQRVLVGLDVSGSMGSTIANSHLSAREGAAAMVMTRLRTAPFCEVMAFQNSFVPLKVSKNEKLSAFCHKVDRLSFGSTDCAQPMLYALERKIPVDLFEVYTDNETWSGRIHPFQALKKYRQAMGIDAKLVVVGMTATEFSIADPSDRGMLDVVGFDAAAPEVIQQFADGF